MKTTLLFAVLFTSTIFAKKIPLEWQEIDFGNVLPIQETPAFSNHQLIFKGLPSTKRIARIFGGNEATPNSAPYQIGLILNFSWGYTLCGASVLSANSVLTAAHCIRHATSTVTIAGAHNIQNIEPTQQRFTVYPSIH